VANKTWRIEGYLIERVEEDEKTLTLYGKNLKVDSREAVEAAVSKTFEQPLTWLTAGPSSWVFSKKSPAAKKSGKNIDPEEEVENATPTLELTTEVDTLDGAW